MVSYTTKLKEVLPAHGCYYERAGRGDHEIWYSPITQRYFPVDHKILSRHTANGVLKQAGIPTQFWFPFRNQGTS